MKKLTRDLVVPTISARAAWLIFGIRVSASPAFSISAIIRSTRARRRSLLSCFSVQHFIDKFERHDGCDGLSRFEVQNGLLMAFRVLLSP